MKKFIFDCNQSKSKRKTDVVIVGSGAAGLFAALNLDEKYEILVITKETYKESNSYLAQGGIAAVIDKDVDSIEKHIEDTLICGDYLNRKSAVKTLVENSMSIIEDLLKIGVPFDRDQVGKLLLAREGAHSVSRIARCGDYTGKSIMESLYLKISKQKNIKILENSLVVDLLTSGNTVTGVFSIINEIPTNIFSKFVIIATGGYGNLFSSTTNQKGITGDGHGMFLRSGGKLLESDFIQFHPTAFYDGKSDKKKFLISEAVRGEGAILRNESNEAFMEDRHRLKDLAPRNFVVKEIIKEIKVQTKKYVFLDATNLSEEYFERRFPTIYNHCVKNNINPNSKYIPVVPSAHYVMGGIPTSLKGETIIKNLYCCGESARTGVHGSNRLASNSLLEALVFSKNAAININKKLLDNIDFKEYFDSREIEINEFPENFECKKINGIIEDFNLRCLSKLIFKDGKKII